MLISSWSPTLLQHPHHLQRPISPLDLDEDVEEDDRRRRGGRTPPDMCAVCAETSTPEWRKGPAGARMLCNGCGLMGAKRAKERAQNGERDFPASAHASSKAR